MLPHSSLKSSLIGSILSNSSARANTSPPVRSLLPAPVSEGASIWTYISPGFHLYAGNPVIWEAFYLIVSNSFVLNILFEVLGYLSLIVKAEESVWFVTEI